MRAIPVLWTRDEAVAATGGSSPAPWTATGVSIDSRTIQAGDLFVAIKGPRFDGHAFAAQALAKGAAAVMLSEPVAGLAADAPVLMVDNTLDALGLLGRASRARCSGRIIGVTGSVGKTGVKEALATVLAASGPTTANVGSLNNHWGLPLSLARMPRNTAFGVFEMGMNHPGEIAVLTELARPHVSVITTVEAVHKAFFPSVEAIADAKAEIFAGMEPGGTAVLNRDNPHFARLADAAARSGVDRVIKFGRHANAEVRLIQVERSPHGARVRASVFDQLLDYRLAVAGNHWVVNSLCVLAAVCAAGADVKTSAAALATFSEPKGRGQRQTIALAEGSFELIDDSYNASPASMAAALAVLGDAVPEAYGRRIAVLGDMLELGDDAAALHAGLADPLQRHGIDLVFTAGPAMAHLFEALPPRMRGGHAADSTTLVALIRAAVRAGDVVTVKGSAGSRMAAVVEALKALGLSDNRNLRGGRVVNGGWD